MASRDDSPAPGGGFTAERLRRLLALLTPHRARFVLATLALFVGSALTLAYPQAAKRAVDIALLGTAGEAEALGQLNRFGALLVGAFVLHSGLVWTRHYLMSWLGQRVVTDLRQQVFARILTLPPPWFHERHSGELVGRLAADVELVQMVIGSELSVTLRNVVQLVGGVTLLFIENARLTLWMMILVPPLSISVVVFGRRIRRRSRVLQDELARASAHVQEAVAGIRTVQSFVRERHQAELYRQDMESSFDEGVSLARWRAGFFAAVSLATYLSVAAIVWLGGREVTRGGMTGGQLAAFILYTGTVAVAVASMAGVWGSLMRAAGATERLYDIIDLQPDIEEPAAPQPLPPSGGAVRFEQVSFAYPSRPQIPALSEVSFEVAPGATVAVVGASGAGKTTLSSLLLRFFDVGAGRVTLDGVDVRDLRLRDLRRAIAIVDQEPLLFSGTIAENIGYGLDHDDDGPARRAIGLVDRAAIAEAAKKAHAHRFIEELPDGYETLVGERGVKLSGGQRQRIAIARAILRDARVLLLDEATSNLDAESEALVHAALDQLMVGRTTIIIAHRLSTVRRAGHILVLDHGRIVERGTHDALMAIDGVYRRLVEHQL